MKKQVWISKLDNKEWESIALLLSKGYSLHDALSMLQKDVTLLIKALQNGLSMMEICGNGQSKKFYLHFRFFYHICSLSDAILCTIHMLEFENRMKQNFYKKLSYPLFILSSAFITLLFFVKFVIPQLLSMFEMTNNYAILFFIIHAIQYFLYAFILIIISLPLFFYFFKKHQVIRNRMIKHLIHKIAYFKNRNSYILSGYFIELSKRGIATKESIQYLLKMRTNTILYHVLCEWQEQLYQGNSLEDIINQSDYISAHFKQTFLIGMHSDHLRELLFEYMQVQELQWLKKMKRFSIMTQAIAYGLVGGIVIIVFQIMMIPLNMLEQL